MNASELARQILTDMWEVGRVVLITAFGAASWGAFLKRYESKSEHRSFQVRLFFITLVPVGGFSLLAFLNVSTGNIIALMYVKPAWGTFTGLVALSVFLFVVMNAYKLLAARRNESPLSIRETAGELPRSLFSRGTKFTFAILSLLMIASIFWLWRITQ